MHFVLESTFAKRCLYHSEVWTEVFLLKGIVQSGYGLRLNESWVVVETAFLCCFCNKEHFLPLPGSAVSKFSSKTSRSSAPSSLTIQTFSETSNASSLPTPRSEGEILSSPNLKPFTFNELKNATRNFRPDSLLGEGGFGYVFKGWIDEHTFSAAKPGSGMVVAVKKLKSEGFQGHKEWLVGLFLFIYLFFILIYFIYI